MRSYDSVAYKATLEEAAAQARQGRPQRRRLRRCRGQLPHERITAEYYLPHLAHASMEPPAASARIVNGKCEVWGCFQSPQAARDLVAKRLGMPAENVTVHVTLARRRVRAQVQARLRHRGGGAVQGDGRQAGQGRVDARRRSAQRLFPYRLRRASGSRRRRARDDRSRGCIAPWRRRSCRRSMPGAKQEANWELGMGVINVPFAIPNIRIENPEAVAHTRIGWFRSVSNIPHAFAVQSFVAELAAAAGRDPKDFLLDVIGPARVVSPQDARRHVEPRRIARALSGRHRPFAARRGNCAAKEAGWGRSLPKGSGLGIAAHYSFVSYVAAVVEVAVDDKGERDDSARGHRGRLRSDRQSGPRACADGRGLRHGRGRGDAGRDHVQERPCAAGQFQQLRGDAHVRGAARDPCAHRAAAITASRWAAWASRACRRFFLRCAMRSLRRQASAYDSCRSAIS